ncbi:LysM peptidoglycan-binding domain-containing protein [Lactobacillus xujianguonis]|uniref:LysM peptidoglycan-binding domain-containing protein n=1 Tax=Lactobacillus xujianguonis TaxID=2495899 RepID=A0A437ST80_9LACO|nr:LysM peptidoglycan-binding domain-containing protein [Lactobacillus xujianguonis]RVU70159.1 LysM peptidoglycan-binding domain-containing protein [Lactobacillus xujianguonis]
MPKKHKKPEVWTVKGRSRVKDNWKIVQPKSENAVTKAKKAYNKAETAYKKANKAYNSVNKSTDKALKAFKKLKSNKKTKKAALNKAEKKYKDWKKRAASSKKKRNRAKDKRDSAKAKLKKVTAKQDKANEAKIASAITEHNKQWNNEGHMAIYPTGGAGGAANVVFFAPVNTESESNSSNITSWPVDKGAPRSSYARVSSKTVEIDGLLSDTDAGTAHDKWVKLRGWHSSHRELTFKGDIYYKHLLISQLNRQFTGYKNTMQVSITFTFVRAAQITTSSGKKTHKKASKSHKTVAGKRSKKYTKVTIRRGDTLWKYSQKYGKSVSWLKKVNHLKSSTIIAGKPLRVK